MSYLITHVLRLSALFAVTLGACHATLGQVFDRTFDAPWIGYDTAVYPEGLNPWASRAADFNGDDVPDLAVSSWGGTPYLSVLIADGAGGYLPPVTYPIFLESLDLEVGDFDLDNDIDIVVNNTGRFWEGFTVELFRNDGSGNFTSAGFYTTGVNGPTKITTGHFNGDEFLDIAVAHDDYIVSGNTFAILMNNTNGGFGPPQVIVTLGGTRAIDAGDLDGDLDDDLVIGTEGNRFLVAENNGGFFFVTDTYTGLDVGSIPELPQVHITDIDLDNDNDIFFSNRDTGGFSNGQVGLWRNNGDGTFATAETIPFNAYASGAIDVETADVNGDNWPDILAATGWQSWFLVKSDGAGGFLPAQHLRAGMDPLSMEAVDLDGDDDLEVVVVASGSLEACVYTNPGDGTFIQPPVIDMTSPSLAPSFPTNLEAKDIDNDGDLDFVAGFRSDFSSRHGFTVRRNNGDGTFAAIEEYTDTTYPLYIQVGDIDGDNDVDALWIDSEGRVRLRRNDGTGAFGSREHVGTVWSGAIFGLWDIEGDNDLDIVVGSYFNVDVMLNDGTGSFGFPIQHDVGGGTGAIAMGDFNGDTVLDVLTPSAVQGYPEISNGNGDGTFAPPNSVPTGRDVHAFAVGDLDHDNNLDFTAIYNLDEKGLSVRRGRGDGNFFLNQNYHGSYGWNDHTSTLDLGDANRDSHLDAMTANFSAQDLSYWQGIGDGSFARLVRYGVGEQAYDVAYGDFDGDSIGDAAVITQAYGGRWWYSGIVLLRGTGAGSAFDLSLTQSTLRPGQPATFTATDAQPGELVYFLYSLTGTGAGPCPPQLGGLCIDLLNRVTQMGSATANGAGAASLTLTVPANAPPGTAVHTQAVARRGQGGMNSVKSNPVSATILP